MIIRGRTKPIVLKKYDAMIPRLPPNFPGMEEMRTEQARRHKGYVGEQKVDYHIDILTADFTILHDVSLEIRNKTFQLDTIVITQHAIFIVESKNYSGTITFDTILQQLTRNDGKKESGYQYPITQVELQQLKLQQWLQLNNHTNIPIYFFIAISEPSTIINVIGEREGIARVVAHGAAIPKKVLDMNDTFKKRGASTINHRKIGQIILQGCKDFDMAIMAKHGVCWQDLLPGVQCLKCGWLGMERESRKWHCPKCSHISKYAHQRALDDYFLLVSARLTNKRCMWFLKLRSRHIVSRLLKSSKRLNYHLKNRSWTLK